MLELVRDQDQARRRPPLGGLDPIWTATLLTAVALVAWAVTVGRMRGMDAGPGTSLGPLGWFVGIWVTMMAAMMLPSLEPTVLLFARVAGERRRQGRGVLAPTWLFVAGYLAVWTVYGLVAYGVFRVVVDAGPAFLAWDRAGPYVAGGVVVAAGLYELTPLKRGFLRSCRNPFHVLFFGWRDGRFGGVRMGAEHGALCVGCCFGLMAALFALGVMSLLWMGAIAAVIFVEKVTLSGARLRLPIAIGLIVFGLWVAAAPASVPALVQPGGAPAMHMGS
jgi:predicted metal-binding membrane protein